MLVATVIFYVGPLAVRGLDWSVPAELALLMVLAALGAVAAGLSVGRGRGRVLRRMPFAVSLLVATAVLRWAVVEYTEVSSQLVSGLPFLALLGVGLIYVVPGRRSDDS